MNKFFKTQLSTSTVTQCTSSVCSAVKQANKRHRNRQKQKHSTHTKLVRAATWSLFRSVQLVRNTESKLETTDGGSNIKGNLSNGEKREDEEEEAAAAS